MSIRRKRASSGQIRTGNAVIDDLIAAMKKYPGTLIVTSNPAQAKEIEEYGVPAEDVGVLRSLRSGVAIVLDREIYDRSRAKEDQLIAQLQAGDDA